MELLSRIRAIQPVTHSSIYLDSESFFPSSSQSRISESNQTTRLSRSIRDPICRQRRCTETFGRQCRDRPRIRGNLPNTPKEGEAVVEVALPTNRRPDRQTERRREMRGALAGVEKRKKPRELWPGRRFAMPTRDCIKRELISC